MSLISGWRKKELDGDREAGFEEGLRRTMDYLSAHLQP
jgi:hypothetical protein